MQVFECQYRIQASLFDSYLSVYHSLYRYRVDRRKRSSDDRRTRLVEKKTNDMRLQTYAFQQVRKF